MGYYLFIKICYWKEIHIQVDLLNLEDMHKADPEIKITINCFNPTILTLECHVQIVVSHSPHFFDKCFKKRLIIRILMISNKIFLI